MKITSLFLVIVSALVLTAIGCGGATSANETKAPPTNIKLFPAAEVCSYPSDFINNRFHALGDGKWQAVGSIADGTFKCSGEVLTSNLHNDQFGLIKLEYNASGKQDGASMIEASYNANVSDIEANESTYRVNFGKFAAELIQKSLNQPPPELFLKKVANLHSFSDLKKEFAEPFDVGGGFVLLDRRKSADGNNVLINVKIFSDIALKL